MDRCQECRYENRRPSESKKCSSCDGERNFLPKAAPPREVVKMPPRETPEGVKNALIEKEFKETRREAKNEQSGNT